MAIAPAPRRARSVCTRPALLAALGVAAFTLSACGARAQAVAEAPADSMADEASGVQTIAVAAVSGYDRLMTDIDFLGELAGRPATSQMVEGMLAFFTGGRGLEGLDKSRPIGVMVQTDGGSFTPLVCLPVADLTPVLELAENFGFEPIDAGDGLYELELENQTVFFKQAGAWTYVAQAAAALDSLPADPSAEFAGLVETYDLGVRVLAQNVPAMYRQVAVEQLRQGMEEGLEQKDGESDEDFAYRKRLAETQVEQISDLIEGLDVVTGGLSIDSTGRTIFIDAELSGVEGSDLALAMSVYDDATSGVAAFHRPEKAMSFLSTSATPPELLEKQREQIETTVAIVRGQLEKALAESDEMPEDPAAREAIAAAGDELLDVYESLLLSGRLEIGGSLDLEGDGFDLIFGGWVGDTTKVESAFRKVADAAQKVAASKGWSDFPGVEWGAAEHAGVTLHRMTFPIPAEAERLRQEVGEAIPVTMGSGSERAYLAIGQRGEAALTAAIDASAAEADKRVTPGEMVVSLGAVLRLAEKFVEGQPAAVVGMMLDGMDESPEGADRIVVSTEAKPRGVRIRYTFEEGILRAVAKTAAAAAAAKQQQQGGF